LRNFGSPQTGETPCVRQDPRLGAGRSGCKLAVVTVRPQPAETTPGGRAPETRRPPTGGFRCPSTVRPLPSFPNGYLPGRSCAPRRRRNPTPGRFSGLSQLAELSFTLSVLGVTGDHKGCPGVVDFSHP
jgi:hypothetical protein